MDRREREILKAKDEIMRYMDELEFTPSNSIDPVDLLGYLWTKVSLDTGIKALEELGFDEATWELEESNQFFLRSGDQILRIDSGEVYERSLEYRS